MEQSTNGSNDPTRLDRIERIMEVIANTVADLQQDVKIVLKAQVVMGEQMTDGFAKLAAAQARTEESLRHTDQRMNALILTVDEIVRGRKHP